MLCIYIMYIDVYLQYNMYNTVLNVNPFNAYAQLCLCFISLKCWKRKLCQISK